MKSKEEFMQQYRSQHPERLMYVVLSILSDIVGAIIIVINGIKLIETKSSSKQEELIIYIVIGAAFWIVGFIFNQLLRGCDRNGVLEFERYCSQLESEHKTNYNSSINYKHDASVPLYNEWKCPACGRINQNYVGTCGCGQQKI